MKIETHGEKESKATQAWPRGPRHASTPETTAQLGGRCLVIQGHRNVPAHVVPLRRHLGERAGWRSWGTYERYGYDSD
jgi:hypothetical protein